MSSDAFTAAEVDYLRSQRLGRLVTLAPDGSPQVRPVGFTLTGAGTIDIVGMNMSSSQKFRNVKADPRVSFVVDDLETIEPWRPRGIEIRGAAEALEDRGGLIRIHPRRVLPWGIETDSFAPPASRDVAAG